MVADGRGGTEVSVAVIEGSGTVVAGADTAVAVTTGGSDGVGLGVDVTVGFADGVGLGVSVTTGEAAGTGLGVAVVGRSGVAVGWTVRSRAMAVRGGTVVGTSGSRVSGLGRVTE